MHWKERKRREKPAWTRERRGSKGCAEHDSDLGGDQVTGKAEVRGFRKYNLNYENLPLFR